LGHLTRDFYRHGVITDVLVVEHPSIPVQPWYPDAPRMSAAKLNMDLLRDFCRGKDAMLFFETPFWWPIFDYCRTIGVRTYLVTMYECTPVAHTMPHKFLCPSLLDVDIFHKLPHAQVHLPVDVPWHPRTTAMRFVHNGGYLGMRGRDGVQREGTETVIRAWQYVRTDARITIRVQENVSDELIDLCKRDGRITYAPENVPYEELYDERFDVAVGAQKWNGCSLPLQEAFGSGLAVINTDRFPMNTWLPNAPLVKPARIIRDSRLSGAYLTFDECVIEPTTLAKKVDEWYDKDITDLSYAGKVFGEEMSWSNLKPVWLEELSK
jgi:hypothetical protein